MADHRQRQQVWDLPTRLFHWLLVGLFGFSWWSAKAHHLDWHQYSGIGVCGLIVFRVLWGFVGAETARFSHFVKGPGAVWSYIRTPVAASARVTGHNPLGGWSVAALLVVLIAQVASGLFAVDVDGLESGPLSYLLDFDQGRAAARFHHVSFNVLMILIVLHVIAITVYLAKGRNLVSPMISGFERVAPGIAPETTRLASWTTLLVVLAIVVLLTVGIADGFRF